MAQLADMGPMPTRWICRAAPLQVVQFACERLLREGDKLVLFKTLVPATPAFDAFDAGS